MKCPNALLTLCIAFSILHAGTTPSRITIDMDDYTTRMGIRSLIMNKKDGQCYLNGEPMKLFGLNRHETYPYIGRAASRRLQRRDADILKYDLGCNIVRTSHYPQAHSWGSDAVQVSQITDSKFGHGRGMTGVTSTKTGEVYRGGVRLTMLQIIIMQQ